MSDETPSPPKVQPVASKQAKPPGVVQRFQLQASISQHFHGPLPPPELLEHYEKVLPGGAERIFKMAEKEQVHRHSLESTLPELARWGQRFGFILGLSGIIGGVVLVALDKSIAGFSVFFISLGSLLAAYMYGQRPTPPEKPTEQASEPVREQNPK